MKKVEIIPHAGCIADSQVSGKCAVVIDVLRATSVMCAAIGNGASRIIPITSVEECNSLFRSMRTSSWVLRGGERNTYRIGDFELDNSPLSYSEEQVKGATILMTTTNGTRTINDCRSASRILIGALVNASAVARKADGDEVVLVCSGRKNNYTMEDGYCAGLIAKILSEKYGYALSDLAWQEKDFYERFSSCPDQAFCNCAHYVDIKERLAADVAFCLREDIYDIVPEVYTDEKCGTQEIR